MRGSAIQWCDDTENPVMGCDLCELWKPKAKPPVRICYAGMLHQTRGKNRKGWARKFEHAQPFKDRMAKMARSAPLQHTARPKKPWLNYLPRHIFVSDLGDALSKHISREYLEREIIQVVTSEAGSRHRWLWLTKRPHMMADFSRWLEERGRNWPENLWAGTSITSDATYQRVIDLLKVGDKTTTRFLSVEPQQTPVNLKKWLPKLDWVIQGGASGKDAWRFELDWARDLKTVCAEAGVSYFLKQVGNNVTDGETPYALKLDKRHGGNMKDWPKELQVRQVPK